MRGARRQGWCCPSLRAVRYSITTHSPGGVFDCLCRFVARTDVHSKMWFGLLSSLCLKLQVAPPLECSLRAIPSPPRKGGDHPRTAAAAVVMDSVPLIDSGSCLLKLSFEAGRILIAAKTKKPAFAGSFIISISLIRSSSPSAPSEPWFS